VSTLGPLVSGEVGDGRVLVLPLGSIEQHGPHLPLNTDTVIAEAVAQRAAAQVPAALVAPALAIGASGEHAGFAGTLSIGRDVLAEAIIEIVRTAGPEFVRVVLVNGHGGNADAVAHAVQRCGAEGRNLTAWHPRVDGGDAHAGMTETSVMLALAPDRVRLSALAAGNTTPLRELAEQLRGGGVKADSDNGVLGDPHGASADHGETIVRRWVEELVELLKV